MAAVRRLGPNPYAKLLAAHVPRIGAWAGLMGVFLGWPALGKWANKSGMWNL